MKKYNAKNQYVNDNRTSRHIINDYYTNLGVVDAQYGCIRIPAIHNELYFTTTLPVERSAAGHYTGTLPEPRPEPSRLNLDGDARMYHPRTSRR